MHDRLHVSSDSPFEKSIGFSRAVKIGNLIAISGTAPINQDGTTTHPGNLYLQTQRCLEIVREAVEKADAKMSDIMRTRIFLKDISRWEEAAKAHGEIFGDIRPACTFVEVSRFIRDDWLVELEADCYICL